MHSYVSLFQFLFFKDGTDFFINDVTFNLHRKCKEANSQVRPCCKDMGISLSLISIEFDSSKKSASSGCNKSC